MENIIVAGSSGHAKVVIDIIEKEGKFTIVGLIDTYKEKGTLLYGYEIMGTESDLPSLVVKYSITGGIVTIGDNWTRKQMVERILADVPDFRFVSAIHPSAQLGRGVKIGNGTVVMGGVIVNSDAHIGEHCILNTSSSVDHDSFMDDFSSLAPKASTGGNVKIGAFSAICLGVNVNNGLIIGEHTVIGSGSMVLSDIEGYSVAYGLPARIMRKREAGDKYL